MVEETARHTQPTHGVGPGGRPKLAPTKSAKLLAAAVEGRLTPPPGGEDGGST